MAEQRPRLRRQSLQSARSGHAGQCRQAGACLDLSAGFDPRRRSDADRGRRDNVRHRALGHRARGRRAHRRGEMDLRSAFAARRGLQALLRHRQSRRRGLQRQGVRRLAGCASLCARRRHRRHLVERRRKSRPLAPLYDLGRAAHRQRQGVHRRRRRRIWRAWRSQRLRCGDRQTRLALVDRAGRSVQAGGERRDAPRPRRPGTRASAIGRTAAAERSGTRCRPTPSSICSTSAPATPAPGRRRSATPRARTISSPRRLSRSISTPANMLGTTRRRRTIPGTTTPTRT